MGGKKEIEVNNVVREHDYTTAKSAEVEEAYEGLLGEAEDLREELKIIPLRYPNTLSFVEQFHILLLDAEKLRKIIVFKKRQEGRSQPRAANG